VRLVERSSVLGLVTGLRRFGPLGSFSFWSALIVVVVEESVDNETAAVPAIPAAPIPSATASALISSCDRYLGAPIVT
jgi:hypothetical protein